MENSPLPQPNTAESPMSWLTDPKFHKSSILSSEAPTQALTATKKYSWSLASGWF